MHASHSTPPTSRTGGFGAAENSAAMGRNPTIIITIIIINININININQKNNNNPIPCKLRSRSASPSGMMG